MAERVDFYILPGDTEEARWDFACRLTEKAYKLGNQVCLLVDNAEQAARLDKQLWVFRPESFVPHHRHRTEASEEDADIPPAALKAVPVLVAATPAPVQHFDLLINLASERLEDLSQVTRLAEVVIQDPQVLLSTRQQFSYYKSLHLPVLTHKL